LPKLTFTFFFKNCFFKALLFLALPYALHANQLLNKLNANNDHALWLESNITKKLAKEWSITLRTEQRFGADYRLYSYQEYGFLLQYNITKFFDLSPPSIFRGMTIASGFVGSEAIQRNTRGKFHWDWIYRTVLEADLTFVYCDWWLRERVRTEYHAHQRKHYKDFFQYRYRMILNTPWKLTAWKFNPLIQNEWFFREQSFSRSNPRGIMGGWYQNRFRVGIEFKPVCDLLTTTLYWQWRIRKRRPGTRPRWANNYQIGFILNAAF